MTEIEEVQAAACRAIEAVMRAAREEGKYGEFVWAGETIVRHIGKGGRHAQTALLQIFGEDDSTEDHVALALTRLAMAKARMDRTERHFKEGAQWKLLAAGSSCTEAAPMSSPSGT